MRNALRLGLAALVVALAPGVASAAPLMTLYLEASTSASGPYSSTLTIAPGTTYYYEITALISPLGTVDGTRTLSSLTPVTNGISTASVNVTNAGGAGVATLGVGSLGGGFGTGTLDASGGTADGNGGLTGIRGDQGAGNYAGVDSNGHPVVVTLMTGTFTTASTLASGLSDTISMSFGGITSGMKINGTTVVPITTASEGGATPIVGYSNLTLITPSSAMVPEPSSVVLLGTSAVMGLVALRRRRRSA